MSKIPHQYEWLLNESAPRLLVEGLKLYGVMEAPGKENNPTIIQWAKNLGGWIASWYKEDETPWCGLFMAEVCKNAGILPVRDPLRAMSWADYGSRTPVAMLGDVLVFKREGGGHVGIYVGEDDTAYHVLGGNQGNMVNITRILKPRCVAIRRTKWRVGQPKNVRVVRLQASGIISENEA